MTENDPITTILELTNKEASLLAQILLRGVDWTDSGKLGETAKHIYSVLAPLVKHHATWRTEMAPDYPVWKEGYMMYLQVSLGKQFAFARWLMTRRAMIARYPHERTMAGAWRDWTYNLREGYSIRGNV